MVQQISRILFIALALMVWACTSDTGQQTGQEEQNHKAQEQDHDHDHGDGTTKGMQSEYGAHFGEEIRPEGAIAFDEMISRLEGKDSLRVKIRAKVDAVCQKKGCWMNVSSAQKPVPDSIFVRFKDYGFFMPKDISGREVVMRGKAYKELTPVDELRHYAEDAGKSEEEIQNITEPKEEMKFLADGVLLLPEESPVEK